MTESTAMGRRSNPTEALRCPVCHGRLQSALRTMFCARCAHGYPVDGGVVRLLEPDRATGRHAEFYSAPAPARYGRTRLDDALLREVRILLEQVPTDGLVLEIGSGAGALDAVHPGYIACDFSLYALQRYSTGFRVQADARALPFGAGLLDAVITWATLEHVPEPEDALAEIHRCLKPGGRALIFPAWFVRPWASRGLHVRPYRGLSLRDRLSKATIALRDNRAFWAVKVLPFRLAREAALGLGRREMRFACRRLEPNLETYLVSDSDAFASMDPQAVAAFFLSRGYKDLGRPSGWRRLLYGYEPVVVTKPAAG